MTTPIPRTALWQSPGASSSPNKPAEGSSIDDGMTLLVVNEVHAVRGDGVPVGVFTATNVLGLLGLLRARTVWSDCFVAAVLVDAYLIAPRSARRRHSG